MQNMYFRSHEAATSMPKVPVVLLDIAHICSSKHTQVVMCAQELLGARTSLHGTCTHQAMPKCTWVSTAG